jgi:hypothetical protein
VNDDKSAATANSGGTVDNHGTNSVRSFGSTRTRSIGGRR